MLHVMTITSPSTLLCTKDDLAKALVLIDRYKNGHVHPDEVTEKKLWRAKQIKDSMLHPQTGEVIPAPFRLSAFMPTNVIICYGMMLPNASLPVLLFWQWMNQSYNLLVNHANRNASNPMSNSQIGLAYAVAVTASSSIAVGLSQLVKRGIVPSMFRHVVPYTAVASAGMANVFVMRYNEISEGVMVQDEHGKDMGVSQIAGKMGVSLSAVSRAVWSIPALVIPPITMALLKRNAKFAGMKRIHLPLELLTIGVSITFGVPFAIALFKSDMEVEVDKLEARFQGMTDSQGHPLDKIYFHKGM